MKIKTYKANYDGKDVALYFKAIPVRLKVINEEERIIEAYASVFGNIDSYGDIVDKGAFVEWLAQNPGRYPKACWAHSWQDIIGPVILAEEDEYGLRVQVKLTKGVQRADEAYLLAKDGALTDWSFGFSTIEDYMDPTTHVRHLKKLAIYEVSPVLVGANNLAMTTAVKSSGGVELKEEGIEDEPGKGKDTPPAPVKVDEPKQGRVLSAKSRAAIEGAHDAMQAAVASIEALLQAADEAESENSATAVDRREPSALPVKQVVKLIIGDARRADKMIGSILVRAKRIRE